MIAFFFRNACNRCFSRVIVFGFEYCTVKLKKNLIIRIISYVIVVGYVLVSETIIV